MKTNHKNVKKSCKIALFNSKSATESLKPHCLDLQFCLKTKLYKVTALLTVTKTRIKDPRYRQNKRLYKILYLGRMFSNAISSIDDRFGAFLSHFFNISFARMPEDNGVYHRGHKSHGVF